MTRNRKPEARKKVLIVDDELDVRIYVRTLFETSGFAPTATRDGIAGLQKAKELTPDLIVLDVMMPETGGVNMYRELKTDPKLKDIPVIMLTAVGKKSFSHYLKMLNIQSEASIPQPDAYMEKPLDHEKLLELAEKLIG
ncbi:MAG: response regulator [Desulfobacterales bacterium]|nr:MAG: response regulator [Desulfobacterales bacterium]